MKSKPKYLFSSELDVIDFSRALDYFNLTKGRESDIHIVFELEDTDLEKLREDGSQLQKEGYYLRYIIKNEVGKLNMYLVKDSLVSSEKEGIDRYKRIVKTDRGIGVKILLVERLVDENIIEILRFEKNKPIISELKSQFGPTPIIELNLQTRR